jgi:hypothetical protein
MPNRNRKWPTHPSLMIVSIGCIFILLSKI